MSTAERLSAGRPDRVYGGAEALISRSSSVPQSVARPFRSRTSAARQRCHAREGVQRREPPPVALRDSPSLFRRNTVTRERVDVEARMLVVDDEAMLAHLCAAWLRDASAVDTASDGERPATRCLPGSTSGSSTVRSRWSPPSAPTSTSSRRFSTHLVRSPSPSTG